MRGHSARFSLVAGLIFFTWGVLQCTESNGGGSNGDSDSEGLRQCCELGAVCHRVPPQDLAISECHDIGHQNIGAQCRAHYERCLELCQPGGEGGQAGEPVEHSCR